MRTHLKSQDYQNLAKCARDHGSQVVGSTTIHADSKLELIATGGYNNIWRVESTISAHGTFILRLPQDAALHPWQLENEAAWLRYMTNNHPSIRVPALLDWSTKSNNMYLAEKFIDAPRLSDIWCTYSEDEKLVVAQNISKLIVDMAELRFDRIGGLKIDGTLGPTVEGMKLFKGRNNLHSSTYYNIGPYDSL